MNNTLLIILIILVSIILIILSGLIFYYFINKKRIEDKKQNEVNNLNILLNNINQLRDNLDHKIENVNKSVTTSILKNTENLQKQYKDNHQIYDSISKQLQNLELTNKEIMNFSTQLQDFQNILKNPKQRGVLGEFYLQNILENILPPGTYAMQYKLGIDDKAKKELIVDAVIFIQNKIIPIDSKFSLENYERIQNVKNEESKKEYVKQFKQDIKLRIEETSKYIRPDLGTMQFAFMFIPAEAIFYDLLVNQIGNDNLIEYAMREKKVIIVSPTSFLAYLQTVLQGLRALEIEKSAHEIRKYVIQLNKHLDNYNEYFYKLGKHLNTTVNTYNTTYKEFNKIDKDLRKLGSQRQEKLEILEIDKTNIDK